MENLVEERKKLFQILRDLNLEVNHIKKQINENEEEIKKSCEHDLVIDRTYQAEHTEWICKKCGFNI